MRRRLKYFLVTALLLGAVVLPFLHQRLWERREAEIEQPEKELARLAKEHEWATRNIDPFNPHLPAGEEPGAHQSDRNSQTRRVRSEPFRTASSI